MYHNQNSAEVILDKKPSKKKARKKKSNFRKNQRAPKESNQEAKVAGAGVKDFRLAAKNLFLTYPQCELPVPVVDFILYQKLKKYGVLGMLTRREFHDDGSPHLHALVCLDKRLDTVQARFLDISGDEAIEAFKLLNDCCFNVLFPQGYVMGSPFQDFPFILNAILNEKFLKLQGQQFPPDLPDTPFLIPADLSKLAGKNFHGNFQGAKKVKSTFEYLTKDILGNFMPTSIIEAILQDTLDIWLSGNLLQSLGPKGQYLSLNEKALNMAYYGQVQEAMLLIRTEDPTMYLLKYNSILKTLQGEYMRGLRLTAHYNTFTLSLPFHLVFYLYTQSIINRVYQSLVVIGRPGIGKTELIKSFLQEHGYNPLLIKELNGLEEFTPGVHTAIIMDDPTFDKVNREKLIALLDGDQQSLGVRYKNSIVPEGVVRVLISNKGLEDIHRNLVEDAVLRRCLVYYIGDKELLFGYEKNKHTIEQVIFPISDLTAELKAFKAFTSTEGLPYDKLSSFSWQQNSSVINKPSYEKFRRGIWNYLETRLGKPRLDFFLNQRNN